MPLVKRGDHWYGDVQVDIRAELLRYSGINGYVTEHYADAVCRCGSRTFRLLLDEIEGAAVGVCHRCDEEHPIGDSADFLADAELEECECVCGGGDFEITAGVAMYEGSDDVRWLYLGCRCTACGLTACYGDWKNEVENHRAFLGQV